jgi:hypothetical protein
MEDVTFFDTAHACFLTATSYNRFFYVGHPGVMKVHKVNNNRHSQISRFCIIHGFNHSVTWLLTLELGGGGWKNQLLVSGASFYEGILLERGGRLV